MALVTGPARYRTRPVEVTALRYELDGSNLAAVLAFIAPAAAYLADGVTVMLQGRGVAPGDWVVRVHAADLRAVPPGVFELAYSPVGPGDPAA